MCNIRRMPGAAGFSLYTILGVCIGSDPKIEGRDDTAACSLSVLLHLTLPHHLQPSNEVHHASRG